MSGLRAWSVAHFQQQAASAAFRGFFATGLFFFALLVLAVS
jgi:hypothetical protein